MLAGKKDFVKRIELQIDKDVLTDIERNQKEEDEDDE